MRILTQQTRVPWHWVVIALLPWTANVITQYLNTVGLTFTLKKFTDDPLLISLITGSKQAIALIVGAFVSFASDRIWTRWGRRKPFLIMCWGFSGIFVLFVPFAPSLWWLIACILVYVAFIDMNGPYEVATMEVIPPPQRGRAGAITHLLKLATNLFFFSVLIANFDRRWELFGLSVTGEKLLYGAISAILLTNALVYGLFVQEVRPANAAVYRWRDLPVRSFLKEVFFSADVVPLYGLMFAMQTFWIGTLQFEPLLVTEQWGYSKATYGHMISIGLFTAVFAVPLGGWLSDRANRLKITRWGLIGMVTAKLLYYVYCEYLAPGGIPPFAGALALSLIRSVGGSFLSVACVPLIFDLLDTNRFGTFACGNMMVISLVTFVGSNVMGLWVKFSSSHLYGLPGGTYNYMAAFHWVFLIGLLGIAYICVFERRYYPRLAAARVERERNKAAG